MECYPCGELPLNYNRSLLFHASDTGSTPVRDASFLNILLNRPNRSHVQKRPLATSSNTSTTVEMLPPLYCLANLTVTQSNCHRRIPPGLRRSCKRLPNVTFNIQVSIVGHLKTGLHELELCDQLTKANAALLPLTAKEAG
jgi:hypothetical protein